MPAAEPTVRSRTAEAHLYYGLLKATVERVMPMLPFGIDRQEIFFLGAVGVVQALDSMPEGLESAARTRQIEEGIATAIFENYHSAAVATPARDDNEDAVSDDQTPIFAGMDLFGSRLLIVDDSAMTRLTMKKMLEKAGFRITEADSGESAIRVASEQRPDLILLDVQMEGLDGFETCQRLKRVATLRDVPVIFLTGMNDSRDVVRGFEAGASDYITKPFQAGEGLSRIRLHLQNQALLVFRQRSIEQLRRVNQTKDKFLRMVSHDLRNPISAIGGLAQMMSDGLTGHLSGEQREMTDSIVSASQGMAVLLNDLLDYAAIEAGEERFKPAWYALAKEIQRVVTLQRVVAERKEIAIKLQQDADLPESLYFDAQGIQRVLENLVSNAIKFSPFKSEITVRISRTLEHALVEVLDEGPGIPHGEEDKLFKEFSRTSNRPTGGEKSTGLGLSICRKIMEMHKGSIHAENRPGKGARFWIQLPLDAGA